MVLRYEYVKGFEQPDILLPNTWIVVRIDGRGFHKYVTFALEAKQANYQGRDADKNRFTSRYDFEKPNDKRGMDLMNAAAMAVMTELPDIVIGYGISDEYSYVLPPFKNHQA